MIKNLTRYKFSLGVGLDMAGETNGSLCACKVTTAGNDGMQTGNRKRFTQSRKDRKVKTGPIGFVAWTIPYLYF